MFFMWNNHPMTKAYPDPIRRLFSIPQRYQVTIHEKWSLSSIASPEPQIVMIDDDSNEPTMPYGFGRQLPIIPPSLNYLNLPPNPFNILATMAVANNNEEANDDNYSPQSPEPSKLSPISTPPMNVSAFNSWETSHTTTNDDTFIQAMSQEEYIFFHQLLPRRRHRPGKWKEDWAWERPFQKMGSVAARLRSLRSDAPSSKGNPRSIKQELETWKHFKLIHELLDTSFIHLNTQRIM